MRICILAAGAAGMYCGSCLRDNVLAGALLRAGHKVTLVPLYTPLRVEAVDVSDKEVFFGGVNSWLQHASGLFRHTPRAIDWLLDRPKFLGWAGNIGTQTSPAKLGAFTVDLLRGEQGPVIKELRRLMTHLANDIKPDVVSLPNLMFIGAARLLRRELGLPVVCELTGEDIFLQAMAEPHRSQARDIISQRCEDVDGLVATSSYYADAMAEYLRVPRQRIKVVHPGLSAEFLAGVAGREGGEEGRREGAAAGNDGPAASCKAPVVAFLARICQEKGLDNLVEAMILLRQKPGMENVRLRVGGWLGKANHAWFEQVKRRVAASNLAEGFEFLGELTTEQKIALLKSADVLSVPTTYREAKGIYVLEAMAAGVPVVQNDHGSFPELITMSGGGVLVPVGDAAALANALAELLQDHTRRAQLGKIGREAVLSRFTDAHMAAKMLEVYQEVMTMPVTKDADPADAIQNPKSKIQNFDPSTPPGPNDLVVTNVQKQYPTPAEPLVVLRGISFSLSPGQSLAIVGPSGSGKSTLLNVLGTLDRPTAGSVRLGSADLLNLNDNELAAFRATHIGFVFQDHHLLPQCTAMENVLMPVLALRKINSADADRAASLLERVGLANRATHFPAELSGGERQRVAIARAVMNQPSLLLCDEPTGNLDAAASRSVGELLHTMAAASQAILVVVTHNADLAKTFGRCERMNEGKLEEN